MNIVYGTMPVIRKEKILRLLGHKDNAVSGRLENKIDACISRMKKTIQPRILYTTKNILKIHNSTLTLDGDVVLKSAKLSKALGTCRKLICFIVTVGDQVDNLISACMKKKKYSDAYIYDAIGSVAVEAAVEKFQKDMDSKVGENGHRTTLRFSPGYCDWKIHEQKKLFSVMKNDLIDVNLNESCHMTPRKSVSGVFGIGRQIEKKEVNPCRSCGMHTCTARRV